VQLRITGAVDPATLTAAVAALSDFLKRLRTVHFAPPKHKFYDTPLNPSVGYAKHDLDRREPGRFQAHQSGFRAFTRMSAAAISRMRLGSHTSR
jgi:hypothetical protein